MPPKDPPPCASQFIAAYFAYHYDADGCNLVVGCTPDRRGTVEGDCIDSTSRIRIIINNHCELQITVRAAFVPPYLSLTTVYVMS